MDYYCAGCGKTVTNLVDEEGLRYGGCPHCRDGRLEIRTDRKTLEESLNICSTHIQQEMRPCWPTADSVFTPGPPDESRTLVAAVDPSIGTTRPVNRYVQVSKPKGDDMPDDQPLKRALYTAFEKMLDESLGAVRPERTTLILDQESMARVERLPEIQLLLKSGVYQMDRINDPRPSIYGFRIELVKYFEMYNPGRQPVAQSMACLFCRTDCEQTYCVRFPIPDVLSFQGVVSNISHVYRVSDELLKEFRAEPKIEPPKEPYVGLDGSIR